MIRCAARRVPSPAPVGEFQVRKRGGKRLLRTMCGEGVAVSSAVTAASSYSTITTAPVPSIMSDSCFSARAGSSAEGT